MGLLRCTPDDGIQVGTVLVQVTFSIAPAWRKHVLLTIARAHKSNVIWQGGGKMSWEKNEPLPCCIVEHFLVRNAYETNTY